MAQRTRRPGIYATMLALIAPAAILPLILLILFQSIRTYSIVSEDSRLYSNEFVSRQALELEKAMNSLMTTAKALATVYRTYGTIAPGQRRAVLSAQAKATLEANPNLLSVWTQWEPGALGDDPAAFAGSPLWVVPSGAFDATWYRLGGRIVQGSIGVGAYSEDFYTRPKNLLREVILDPYRYSYTGKKEDEILETSLCVPIVVDGAFKGVVGFDVDIDAYQRMVARMAGPGNSYTVLTNGSGLRVYHPLRELIGTYVGDDLPLPEARKLKELIGDGEPFTFAKRSRISDIPSLYYWMPVRIGDHDRWMLSLVVPVKTVNARADAAIWTMASLGALATLFVLGSILLAARSLARPITDLTLRVEGLFAGAGVELPADQRVDELRRLAAAFNELTAKLKRSLEDYHGANSALEKLNDELEGKVADRTAALERSLADLRRAQDKMVAGEKFVLLGRLSAGIAHELNTPLAAIRSSIGYLRETGPWAKTAVLDFAIKAEEEDLRLFRVLMKTGLARAADLSIKNERGSKRRLAKELAEAGWADAEAITDDVETMGAFGEKQTVLALLQRGRRDAVTLAANVAASARATLVIAASAEKAASTVSALVDYARTEEFEITGDVEPTSEIDKLIVLYYNEIKQGVEIVRDYEFQDKVPGLRDKLNQVWVNIINNSLQAMSYKGTLTVRAYRDGRFAAYSFEDTGAGIPEAAKAKIFQPFFTTKQAGEGTGLGLDICKKIVERHGGTIAFESEPGRTVFTVRLPRESGGPAPAREA